MPASPTCPTVAQFKELVVSLDSAACDQLRKLARLSATVATAYECIYDADGNFTDQFKAKLCQTGCVNSGGGGVTPPGGGGVTPPSGGLDAVTGLAIRAAANHIETYESYRLTWNILSNATSYTVLRNTSNSVTTATLLAYKMVPDVSESVDRLYAAQTNTQWVRMFRDGSRILFVDIPASTASNVEYFYWVQAHGASDTYSSPSAPVSARRRRPINRFVGHGYPAQTGFDTSTAPGGSAANMIQTVPQEAILATVTLEGGGGGGAGATMTAAGGGGGRGSFVCVEMPVVAGNQVKVVCDEDIFGAAGVSGGNGGSGADAVLYFRSSSAVETWTEMARAYGGGGGMYSAGGAGAGGLAGAAPTAASTVTIVQAYAGFAGGPAIGTSGGYAGGGTFEHRRKRADRGFYAQAELPAVPGGGSDVANHPSELQEPFSAGCVGGRARATLAFKAAGVEVPPSGGFTADHTLEIEETVTLPAIIGGAAVRFNVVGGGGGGGSKVSGTTPGTCTSTVPGTSVPSEGIASGGGSGELRWGTRVVSDSIQQLRVKFNAPIPSGVAGSGATGGAVEITATQLFTPVATAAGGGGGLQGCCDSGNLLGGAAGAGGSTGAVQGDPNDSWMVGLVGATALGGNVCTSIAAGGAARSLGAGAGGTGRTNTLANAGGKGRAVFTW